MPAVSPVWPAAEMGQRSLPEVLRSDTECVHRTEARKRHWLDGIEAVAECRALMAQRMRQCRFGHRRHRPNVRHLCTQRDKRVELIMDMGRASRACLCVVFLIKLLCARESPTPQVTTTMRGGETMWKRYRRLSVVVDVLT